MTIEHIIETEEIFNHPPKVSEHKLHDFAETDRDTPPTFISYIQSVCNKIGELAYAMFH